MGMQVNVICHNSSRLPRVVNRTCLAYNADLDLAWIIETLLNFVRDIAGQTIGREFVDLFRFDDNAHLAASLNGEGFLHAGKRVSDTLQRLHAPDIEIDSLGASAAPGRRDG